MVAQPGTFTNAQHLESLGELPLVVITADIQDHPEWANLQGELSTLSSNNLHVTISDASHASLIFNPQHADQVCGITRQLVEAVRAGSRSFPRDKVTLIFKTLQ